MINEREEAGETNVERIDQSAPDDNQQNAEVVEIAHEEETEGHIDGEASIAADVTTMVEEIETVTASGNAESSVEENTEEPIVEAIPESVQDTVQTSDDTSSPEIPNAIEVQIEIDRESEEHHEEEGHGDHYDNEDFTTYNTDQILKVLAEVALIQDIKRSDAIAKEVKAAYDANFLKKKSEALEQFKAEGGEEADFVFKGEENTHQIEEYFKLIRDRKNRFYFDLEKQKEHNLVKKNELLEKLRHLVDGEESTASINSLNKLQAEWRATGPVPGPQNKTLWANYNALIDRFYDNRSIYFELKELDRKKNLEKKIELCEKAEALDKDPNLKEAVKHLNELHEEYKHIGPVPKDIQEEIWQRFKSASDKVYAKRKEFVDQLKHDLKENMDKKLALAELIVPFGDFASDRINEWNKKTKELLDLQKKWEAIGGLPRDQAKKVNRKFWTAFKSFFANKNKFFKQLESMRGENLQKKEALILKAVELKDSEDWDASAEALKVLQNEWREVGPVPEKVRNELYDKFKAACDHFFNRKRELGKSSDKEFELNLTAKQEICTKLEALAGAKDIKAEDVYKLQAQYNEIGFVPRGAMKKLHARYDKALENIAATAKEKGSGDVAKLQAHISLNKNRQSAQRGGGDQKGGNRQEFALRKKIGQLESDLITLKNNMEFLASSAKADKLKAQFEVRIVEAEEEINLLKEQLKILQE